MRMNMLPEKLRLCRNDGFEAGAVGRVANVARPDFTVRDLLHLPEAAHDRFWHEAANLERPRIGCYPG
jgi:hypothetical protein